MVTELSRARGEQNDTSSKLDYNRELIGWGKKFCVVGQPWLDKRLFEQMGSEFDNGQSPHDTSRFSDDNSYDQGTLTALYEIVPTKRHDDMKGLDEFQSVVSLIHTLAAT